MRGVMAGRKPARIFIGPVPVSVRRAHRRVRAAAREWQFLSHPRSFDLNLLHAWGGRQTYMAIEIQVSRLENFRERELGARPRDFPNRSILGPERVAPCYPPRHGSIVKQAKELENSHLGSFNRERDAGTKIAGPPLNLIVLAVGGAE